MDLFATLCLAGLVVLSLVLPLYAAAAPADIQRRLRSFVLGWQLHLALAGALIVLALVHPGLEVLFATLGCLVMVWKFRQRARSLTDAA